MFHPIILYEAIDTLVLEGLNLGIQDAFYVSQTQHCVSPPFIYSVYPYHIHFSSTTILTIRNTYLIASLDHETRSWLCNLIGHTQRLLVTRVVVTGYCLKLCLFNSWSHNLLLVTINRKSVGHGVWIQTCVRSELAISSDVALHTESCKTRSLEMRI